MKETVIFNTYQLFVGDVCYAISNDIYERIFAKKYNYKEGIIEDKGQMICVVGYTSDGDGLFYDNIHNEFPVDAGNIGVSDLKFYQPGENVQELTKYHLGLIVDVPSGKAKVEFTDNDGVFHIYIEDYRSGQILYNNIIDTTLRTEYDDDNDDNYYEDEENNVEEFDEIPESLEIRNIVNKAINESFRKFKKLRK